MYELELTGQGAGDFGTVHLRYKAPDGDSDIPMDVTIPNSAIAATFAAGSERLRFTVGVAEYAEILRGSPYVNTTLNAVEGLIADAANGGDERDVELLELIRKAQTID